MVVVMKKKMVVIETETEPRGATCVVCRVAWVVAYGLWRMEIVHERRNESG